MARRIKSEAPGEVLDLFGSSSGKEAEVERLENVLSFRIISAARAISKTVSDTLAEDYDLGLAEWQVLSVINHDSALSVREIVPRTTLDAVAVSRAARRLTDRKLLKRYDNPADRRLISLKATKKGREMFDMVTRSIAARERAYLKSLSSQDRIRLLNLLTGIEQELD
ncbi:MarR family winged helix-turn-helix transcriptional regulator [Coralliovum pocilloporae]|uniref:MarR family winged helix-turn-helix transcriptional regulator n=1 Tax=Coralliovum pocilloporae TaxID=3066369 RepID=UPI0033076B8E